MDTKQKRRKFNALLAVGQMMNAKEHILSGYGVESTMDLSDVQLDDVIRRVEDLLNKKSQEADKLTREWRHKCLRLIKECGIDTNNWSAVNAFMLNPRICGKHLYELNTDELQVLHRKLHNVRDNKLKKQQDIQRLATQN
jgi:hypothetical protein